MRPTEPGWYWYFYDLAIEGTPSVEVIKVYQESDGRLFVCYSGTECDDLLSDLPGTFLGPLVPPERPKA